jgi:hypothetical protein
MKIGPYLKSLLLFLILVTLAAEPSEGQIFKRNTMKHAERGLFGKTHSSKKQPKVREPRAATKAKRKQEAHQKKLKKEYEKFVKDTKKHSYEIQTPDVKARMKQNMKDIKARDKAKKKKERSKTRKAGRKYT